MASNKFISLVFFIVLFAAICSAARLGGGGAVADHGYAGGAHGGGGLDTHSASLVTISTMGLPYDSSMGHGSPTPRGPGP